MSRMVRRGVILVQGKAHSLANACVWAMAGIPAGVV